MIILKGNDNEDVLSIGLRDILIQIDDINQYAWKLIWIEGVSHKIHMGKLEKSVNESLDGLMIEAQELIELSSQLEQLIEVVLIGDERKSNLHKLESDEDMKIQYDFFIELIDSSFWEITSKKGAFLGNIKRNLM